MLSNSGSELTFNAYIYQDIERVILTDPMATTAQISANMIPVVLTWTAGNCLLAIWQWTYVSLGRHPLMYHHCHACYQWCCKRLTWGSNDTLRCSVMRASFAFIQVIIICGCGIYQRSNLFQTVSNI